MAEYDSFLRKGLSDAKYKDQDKTRKTILETIDHWKGLKPVSDTFVFNNGTSKALIALKGTLPVAYKGNTYHIPVIIWLLDTFPYNAPMVYVNPTPEMRIKVSRHVDHNGKVYLPYLHDWKHNTSELLLLIQVLIMTFQEQPPVFAVKNTVPPQPAQNPSYPPYPTNPTQSGGGYPPYPVGGMPMPGAMPMPPIANSMQPQQQQAVSPTPPTPTYNFRPSLISAAEEKVKRRLEDAYLSTEIIKNTGQQLTDGQQRLESMIKRLSDEKSLLEQNIETVQKECAALEDKISKSEDEDNEMNIDEAVQAPAPLYKQIVNSVAEEAALEDTIYYLGEAFRREKMDLDQYQRTVRQLARRQFMLRAIIKKCRQKAGLGG